MSSPYQLPEIMPGASVPGALVIGPLDPDLILLFRILSDEDWNFYWYRTCTDALEGLNKKPVSVVICDRALLDGTWKDVLERLHSLVRPPPLIVTATAAYERLWADVLNLGGFDVLVKPFDRDEVRRIVSSAWSKWVGADGFEQQFPAPAA